MCPYFSHKVPLENQFTLGNALTYPRWLRVVLRQMYVVIIIETFDLGYVPLRLLHWWLFVRRLFIVVLRPRLTLAPLSFVATLAPISWSDLIILNDHASGSPLGLCKSFILHTLHHLHYPWHIYEISILW